MRLPRFRVRTLMAAVAVVGMLLGGSNEIVRTLKWRRLDCQLRAIDQSVAESYYRGTLWSCRGPSVPPPVPDARKAAFHATLRRKYEWAARYPWLPVAPDPSAPE